MQKTIDQLKSVNRKLHAAVLGLWYCYAEGSACIVVMGIVRVG